MTQTLEYELKAQGPQQIEKSETEWTLETSPHTQQHSVYTKSVSTLLHLEY